MPQICEAVAKYILAENSVVDLEYKVNHSFADKLNKLNNGELSDMTSIKATRAQTIEQLRMAASVLPYIPTRFVVRERTEI